MLRRSSDQPNRHVAVSVSPYSYNYPHKRNPWVVAWWSLAFPGLGHIMLCKYVVAFVLIGWEVFINNMSGINTAIYFSMLGDFENAKLALNHRWFLLYIPIYIFAVWDSYYKTIQFNEDYVLAYKTGYSVVSKNIDTFEMNNLQKRNPKDVLMWSFFAPGLGYLHLNRLPSAMLFTVWLVVLSYYSGLVAAVQATMVGQFEAAKLMNVQWLLYLPSLYGFVVFDSYSQAVEYNKIFEKEQASFFKSKYQQEDFKMPI